MALLITGAAGFIGSNVVRHVLRTRPDLPVVSYDLLTYSGHMENLADVLDDERHTFVQGDIADRAAVRSVFDDHDIDGVIHLAAESHVDRSIVDPTTFVRTNVVGTVVLLEESARAWGDRRDVRFHHVSTDEVFGSLGPDGHFDEESPYRPTSPYSASKAAADHCVRAWAATFGLPVVITNCSNNYGPFQFPEKLIPVVITRALQGQAVPVYGAGENVRDWIFVDDHCEALLLVFERGRNGATYCIGGGTEISNNDLVRMVLDELDTARGLAVGSSRGLAEFVSDRPGHDLRYAMDITRMTSELGWKPATTLSDGIARTVRWYLAHADWLEAVQNDAHRDFRTAWYGERRA